MPVHWLTDSLIHWLTDHSLSSVFCGAMTLFCTLLYVVLCVHVDTTASSADDGAGRSVVKRKNTQSNSLRIHYPYHIFSGDREDELASNWRHGSKKKDLGSPHPSPTVYFNSSRSQDQEDLWLYENWFYRIENGIILEVPLATIHLVV